MKREIKKFQFLEVEVGKTYQTKMATNERFIVKDVVRKSFKNKDAFITYGIVIKALGIYEDHPEAGICPIDPDRLMRDKIEIGVEHVCSNCGESIEDEES